MTPHDWIPLAINLIRAIVWPAAVVALVWRVGPKFLAAIPGRAVNLEGFGVRASIAAAEQQFTGPDSPVNRPALEPASVAPTAVIREAVQLIEQQIRTELAQYTPDAREPALVNALATTRLRGQHEFNYNRIFGSQIAGLKLLDERGSATVTEAHEFFEQYAKLYPQLYSTYGFDGWLTFMVSVGLVVREGDQLKATPYGHDFLVYLREVRLTEMKPG